MKTMIKTLTLLLLTFQAYCQTDTLFVYGPGGPAAAIKECAQLFGSQNKVAVIVNAGPEPKWIDKAKKDGHVVFGGSEYMLTKFTADHPGIVDQKTRRELYKRAAAILVRPGNPKGIKRFTDLAKSGINLLDVNGAGQLGMWEDIAGKFDVIAGVQDNIKASFANTALAIDAWKADLQYDAWITYGSWHLPLKEVTELVKIPEAYTVYRGTPIAMTTKAKGNKNAALFIEFLKSPQGHKVFQRWGWE